MSKDQTWTVIRQSRKGHKLSLSLRPFVHRGADKPRTRPGMPFLQFRDHSATCPGPLRDPKFCPDAVRVFPGVVRTQKFVRIQILKQVKFGRGNEFPDTFGGLSSLS